MIVNLLPQIHVKNSGGTVKPARKHKKRGYVVGRTTNARTLMTDEQVIEARGLYEFCGWTAKALIERYDVSSTYMRSLLGYQTRCNSSLMPDPKKFGR